MSHALACNAPSLAAFSFRARSGRTKTVGPDGPRRRRRRRRRRASPPASGPASPLGAARAGQNPVTCV
eukprot:2903786-Pyramimonas_sp.AAC.1